MTCGYLCPKCEGKGYTEDALECTWCKPEKTPLNEALSDENWLKSTHEGACCWDTNSPEEKSPNL